jgi:WD40 repeat protein
MTNPANPELAAMLAMVSGQAHHLRPPAPVAQPGYVLRQLWMQAAELREDDLASDLRIRLRSQPNSGLISMWTTRRASHAMSAELGRHDDSVRAVAGLPNGRVASGGYDARVLVWDPGRPGSDPVELGRHDGPVRALAGLPGGRVISGGSDRRVLVWDPTSGTRADAVGRHDGLVVVAAVAGLRDGRVASGGDDGRVLVWDPSEPGSDPVEFGGHDDSVSALAGLPDGRVASGGDDRRVLVWDPDRPGNDPVELGGHDGPVVAVAVLPDGRVVSGGTDRRVLVWKATTQGLVAQLGCSVTQLAAVQSGRGEALLVVVHEGQGFSLWSPSKGRP